VQRPERIIAQSALIDVGEARGSITRMRILLDSRDLINLVEHQSPTTVADFDAYLRAGNHQVVLCFTNVKELAGPIGAGADYAGVAPYFRSLERLPLVYVKESTIFAIEIRSAVNAFNAGVEYQDCSPYVPSWDRTLVTAPGQDEAAAENLGLRLGEVVDAISRTRPDVFAPMPAAQVEALKAILRNDRALLRNGKAPARQNFVDSLKRHAARHRVNLPNGREDEFALWLYQNPNRCPGLRLGHEMQRAILANENDVPQVGDVFDRALICTLPYVDAVTLDRRMRHYCAGASRKMLRFGSAHNYNDRVYENLASLMARHPHQ
jgi:hypothetical protein